MTAIDIVSPWGMLVFFRYSSLKPPAMVFLTFMLLMKVRGLRWHANHVKDPPEQRSDNLIEAFEDVRRASGKIRFSGTIRP